MECNRARDMLGGLVLGELDVEQRRAVEKHLQGCPECCAKRDELALALGALKLLPHAETSEGRRERTVAAMMKEHRDRVEAALRYRIVSPLRMVAAALAVLVLAAVITVGWNVARTESELYVLKVVAVNGTADWASGGEWKPLKKNDIVRSRDRVRTRESTTVQFEVLEGSKKRGELFLNQNTSVDLRNGGRVISIDSGELYAVEISAAVHIVTPSADQYAPDGPTTFEAGLQQTHVLPQPAAYRQTADREGMTLQFTDAPIEEVSRVISEKTGEKIDIDSRLRGARICFFGRADDPHLIDSFSRALEIQNLMLYRLGERECRINVLGQAGGEPRLFVRVSAGRGRFATSRGSIDIGAGHYGEVDANGWPRPRELGTATIANWIQPDYYRRLAETRIRVVPTVIRWVPKGGKPTIEMRVPREPMLITYGGKQLMVEFKGDLEYEVKGEGEVTLPITMKIKAIP